MTTGSIYFFHTHEKSYGFLSQWYEEPFHTGDGTTVYKTAEQYMMHQKALLFSDDAIAAKILAAETPGEQKTLGRMVANFDDTIWNKNRLRIVTQGSYYKFKHSLNSDALKQRLLTTGERELVEAAPRDRIWGVGFGKENAEKNRSRWGLNLLGQALMAARKQLREEEAPEKVSSVEVGHASRSE
ncbi:hypothetical protein BP6252_09834 [Coleophoma cylindrospora]|uniref:NADAR domain-containing protein n=1 Tax=Coleophoma cylindrospora TaxID=1849047 RepID=A0A3D8QWR5_9HELO|nr:hypothetical protein BP6252_09834 [Coleophoma cylindrospora]